jgi:hypothetical protein
VNFWNSRFRVREGKPKTSLGYRSRKAPLRGGCRLNANGNKAKLRESINRPNRARFAAMGLLSVCEAQLPGCWPNGRLTWAHGKKDRHLTMDERKNLVIRCCTVCHRKLDEQFSHEEMLAFVQSVIARREAVA